MMNLRDFSIPVHRSIMRRDLYFGIPFVPLILLTLLTIVMVFTFSQWYFIFVGLAIWAVLRVITKKDEWLLDIVIFSLFKPDYYD